MPETKRHYLPPKDADEVLRRYPRLVGHLISESLGYFTPKSAAMAILRYRQNVSFACEWYIHMARSWDDQKLIEVGRNTLNATYHNRKYHTGCMSNYLRAKALVDLAITKGIEPEGASWF